MKRFFTVACFLVVALCVTQIVLAASIERVNLSTSQTQANNDVASEVFISGDGRYATFTSSATNLVSGDTNAANDIFVYDRQTDTMERVSVDNLGNEANAGSTGPSISSDGRYIAFISSATNLVVGDTNNTNDVFVYDRQTDTIERVSVDDLGNEGDDSTFGTLDISASGRYVAFGSEATNLVAGDTNGMPDVFVYDRQTDTIERVSVDDLGNEGDNNSLEPTISEDGRYVAFSSQSSNLIPADTNGIQDIFVYDRQTDTIERVSVDDLGNEGDAAPYRPAISSDGRYVAFGSDATNLVAGDTNGVSDIFVYDRQTDTIERVSVDDLGNEGDGLSTEGQISEDGTHVTFSSEATNLVSGDTNGLYDVFLYNLEEETIERISVFSGQEGNGNSSGPTVSSDGRYVAFASSATNLVSGDTNGKVDAFVYDSADEVIDEVSSPSLSSGFQTPHVQIRGDASETKTRLVDLEIFAPSTVTRFEISNFSDFRTMNTYVREYTDNEIKWNICKGFSECAPGVKRIYVRFYNKWEEMSLHFVDIVYINKECPYFKKYLRRGYANDPYEVKKAQEFLNQELGTNLAVDGVFGDQTDSAVRVFQDKYPVGIILPWQDLHTSTGFWYITTTAYANLLVGC